MLFISLNKLPNDYSQKLDALNVGYTKLVSKADGVAMDYVRNVWFKPKSMKKVPPDSPGADNDLKDKVEAAVVKALGQASSIIYAFGEKWGPETDKKDKYFKFLPGNGIHDVHMNQGNSGKYTKDNGVYQDGSLVFNIPTVNGSRSFSRSNHRRSKRITKVIQWLFYIKKGEHRWTGCRNLGLERKQLLLLIQTKGALSHYELPPKFRLPVGRV